MTDWGKRRRRGRTRTKLKSQFPNGTSTYCHKPSADSWVWGSILLSERAKWPGSWTEWKYKQLPWSLLTDLPKDRPLDDRRNFQSYESRQETLFPEKANPRFKCKIAEISLGYFVLFCFVVFSLKGVCKSIGFFVPSSVQYRADCPKGKQTSILVRPKSSLGLGTAH